MLSALHPEQSAALEAWERKASVEPPARVFRELASRSDDLHFRDLNLESLKLACSTSTVLSTPRNRTLASRRPSVRPSPHPDDETSQLSCKHYPSRTASQWHCLHRPVLLPRVTACHGTQMPRSAQRTALVSSSSLTKLRVPAADSASACARSLQTVARAGRLP